MGSRAKADKHVGRPQLPLAAAADAAIADAAVPCYVQLTEVVPLLLRAMRAPRLSTARASILTFKDLFVSMAPRGN